MCTNVPLGLTALTTNNVWDIARNHVSSCLDSFPNHEKRFDKAASAASSTFSSLGLSDELSVEAVVKQVYSEVAHVDKAAGYAWCSVAFMLDHTFTSYGKFEALLLILYIGTQQYFDGFLHSSLSFIFHTVCLGDQSRLAVLMIAGASHVGDVLMDLDYLFVLEAFADQDDRNEALLVFRERYNIGRSFNAYCHLNVTTPTLLSDYLHAVLAGINTPDDDENGRIALALRHMRASLVVSTTPPDSVLDVGNFDTVLEKWKTRGWTEASAITCLRMCSAPGCSVMEKRPGDFEHTFRSFRAHGGDRPLNNEWDVGVATVVPQVCCSRECLVLRRDTMARMGYGVANDDGELVRVDLSDSDSSDGSGDPQVTTKSVYTPKQYLEKIKGGGGRVPTKPHDVLKAKAQIRLTEKLQRQKEKSGGESEVLGDCQTESDSERKTRGGGGASVDELLAWIECDSGKVSPDKANTPKRKKAKTKRASPRSSLAGSGTGPGGSGSKVGFYRSFSTINTINPSDSIDITSGEGGSNKVELSMRNGKQVIVVTPQKPTPPPETVIIQELDNVGEPVVTVIIPSVPPPAVPAAVVAVVKAVPARAVRALPAPVQAPVQAPARVPARAVRALPAPVQAPVRALPAPVQAPARVPVRVPVRKHLSPMAPSFVPRSSPPPGFAPIPHGHLPSYQAHRPPPIFIPSPFVPPAPSMPQHAPFYAPAFYQPLPAPAPVAPAPPPVTPAMLESFGAMMAEKGAKSFAEIWQERNGCSLERAEWGARAVGNLYTSTDFTLSLVHMAEKQLEEQSAHVRGLKEAINASPAGSKSWAFGDGSVFAYASSAGDVPEMSESQHASLLGEAERDLFRAMDAVAKSKTLHGHATRRGRAASIAVGTGGAVRVQ